MFWAGRASQPKRSAEKEKGSREGVSPPKSLFAHFQALEPIFPTIGNAAGMPRPPKRLRRHKFPTPSMGRMRSMFLPEALELPIFIAVVDAGAGHAFAEAALLNEVLLKAAELLVNQIVGLMNKADGNVGDGFRRAGFDKFPVEFKGLRLLSPQVADEERLFTVRLPDEEVADAEKVEVVIEQLFEAGAGNIGEFDFRFLGGEGGFAAFEDVFLSRAGRLNHLVNGAVAARQVFMREAKGDVVDDFRFLE